MDMKINPSEYKILVVDDVMSNLMLLKVLLTSEKFGIMTASNGHQAIEMTQNEKPDLLLLDVMMPDLSGFEVAKKLKSDPQTSDVPIIFLTALNSTADIVKGFEAGGNDFISKPFNKEELITRIYHQISLVAAKRLLADKNTELEHIIAGRDRLYSVIAHDLRSPIGSIKMVLNMLLVNLTADKIGKDMHELLVSANQTTEDVFSLLDNLLKWSKSQTGQLSLVPQEADLTEIVNGVLEIFKLTGDMKRIELEMKPCGPLMVNVDIDTMKTIVRNLLSNAYKFSSVGSKITVQMEKKDGMAIMHIKDQGCGISQENQLKLMNPETAYTTYGTKNEEGSGLGLLLCKDFITRNGGKIWFTSTEGVGSTFSISLPLLKR